MFEFKVSLDRLSLQSPELKLFSSKILSMLPVAGANEWARMSFKFCLCQRSDPHARLTAFKYPDPFKSYGRLSGAVALLFLLCGDEPCFFVFFVGHVILSNSVCLQSNVCDTPRKSLVGDTSSRSESVVNWFFQNFLQLSKSAAPGV